MRNHSLIVLCLSASACTSLPAPNGWLPTAEVSQQDGFGGWIEVWDKKSSGAPGYWGELLAVSHDSLFVATALRVEARPLSSLVRAKVTGFDPKAGELQSATFVGMFSTLSHGLIASLSAPTWLLIGLPTAHSAVGPAQVSASATAHSWDSLRRYARFPQGLPEGLDLSTITMKRRAPPPAGPPPRSSARSRR